MTRGLCEVREQGLLWSGQVRKLEIGGVVKVKYLNIGFQVIAELEWWGRSLELKCFGNRGAKMLSGKYLWLLIPPRWCLVRCEM